MFHEKRRGGRFKGSRENPLARLSRLPESLVRIIRTLDIS